MRRHRTPREERYKWEVAASMMITGGGITTLAAYALSIPLGVRGGVGVLFAGIVINMLALKVWL